MAYHPVASLKCIDLSNPNIHESVDTVKEVCSESGVFYVINHGISEELVNEIFDQIKKFCELPRSEKTKLRTKDNNLRGLRGYCETSGNYPETYSLGGVLEDDPTNIWPPADLLPGWKETVQRFCREALDAGRAVARLMALALNLSNIDFFYESKMIGEGTNLNILHYTVEETDGPLKARKGTIPHTDVTLLSLLITDDVYGLQICKDKYANPQIWEYVRPLKGALILFVGDIMEMISNGTLRATMHRVEYCEERYSLGYFMLPNPEAIIECLPTCTSEDKPPKYRPISSADLMKHGKDLYVQDVEKKNDSEA